MYKIKEEDLQSLLWLVDRGCRDGIFYFFNYTLNTDIRRMDDVKNNYPTTVILQ